MIKEVKLFSYRQKFGGLLPLPLAMYMYKIINSINVFLSEMLTICSNVYASLNKMAVMSIYGKPLKKIFSSRTKKALRLNLRSQHRGLKVC